MTYSRLKFWQLGIGIAIGLAACGEVPASDPLVPNPSRLGAGSTVDPAKFGPEDSLRQLRDLSVLLDGDRIDAAIASDQTLTSDAATTTPPVPPSPPVSTGLPPLTIPSLTTVTVNCATAAISDRPAAKKIYDALFASRVPQTETDFAWQANPGLISKERVERVAFYNVGGQTNDAYHRMFSFDPARYERITTQTNWDIFGSFNPAAQRMQSYRRYNPLDYVPAALTHYTRKPTGTTDVMADQLVYRLKCYPEQMKKAFALCPDCTDVFVPLSRYDIHKIFEVRFVRVKENQLQVSNVFKLIAIDASGHMFLHGPTAPYPYIVYQGSWLKAKWRAELSGLMAQRIGTYGGPTAGLLRLSQSSLPY